MNHDQKPVGIPAYAKLINALEPERRDGRFVGEGVTRKSAAIRRYAEANRGTIVVQQAKSLGDAFDQCRALGSI